MRYFWSSASNYPTVGRLTKKWKTQFQYHGLAPIGLEFVGLVPVGVVVVGSLVWPATGPHRTNKKSSGIRKLYMNFSLKAVRDSAQSIKRTVRDISMQLRNVPYQHKFAWTEESSLCKKNHECLLTVRESHESSRTLSRTALRTIRESVVCSGELSVIALNQSWALIGTELSSWADSTEFLAFAL